MHLNTSEYCRYIVEQLLGSGGFGDVYKAKKIGTNEYYAIKTELNEFNGKKIDRLKVEICKFSKYANYVIFLL